MQPGVPTTSDPASRVLRGSFLALCATLCAALVVACGAGGGGESGGSGGEDDGDDGSGGGGGDPGTDFDDYQIQFGMNVSRGGYADREIVLADAMGRASAFGMYENNFVDLTQPPPLIPYGQGRVGEGWPDFGQLAPGEVVGARIFSAMEGSVPDGRTEPYVLEWKGEGSCSLSGTLVASERNRTDNRVEVFVDPTASGGDGFLSLLITASSPSDPVRDVHVWFPGLEATRPLFWQPYLDRMMAMNDGNGPFVVRTTDWTRAYNYGSGGVQSFTFDLDAVPTPRSPSQNTAQGMAVEFVVAFANETGRDVLLQVPHQTDDLTEAEWLGYLEALFDRVANGSPAVPELNGGRPFEGLDPERKVWVELSNEIWNSGYAVHGWMQREAARKGIGFEAQVAGEIEKVFQVAEQVFSGPGDDRLRRYVGGHIANITFLEGVLNALPPGRRIDGMGPACYFSEQDADIQRWLSGADQGTGSCPNCPTTEELIAAGRATIPQLAVFVGMHRALVDSWTNPDGSTPLLMLYEGGQHFVAGNYPWADAVNDAQVHPDMYYAYADDLIPMLVAQGVDAILWYSFMSDQDVTPNGALGPFGVWNDMESTITLPVPEPYVHEDAPKAAAIYRGPPLKAQ